MKNLVLAVVCAVALSAGFATSANAAIIVERVTLGDGAGWNLDNVISNRSCNTGETGPALTITGCLNSKPDFGVEFTSDELIKFAAGGQASVVADDGIGFSQLTIGTTGDALFDILVVNIDLVNRLNGWVTFTGTPGGPSQPFELRANGVNRFAITGSAGGFESVSFSVTGENGNAIDAVADVKQVRLGTVPEPTSMVLLGLGFLGAGIAARRRQ